MADKSDTTFQDLIDRISVTLPPRFYSELERLNVSEDAKESQERDSINYMQRVFERLHWCAYYRQSSNQLFKVQATINTQEVIEFLNTTNELFVPDAYDVGYGSNTLLHVMCQNLMDDLVPHALSAGVPFDQQKPDGVSYDLPVWYAISNALPETADKAVNIMRHMKAHAGDRPIWGEHELNMLLSATNGSVMQELIDQGANPYQSYALGWDNDHKLKSNILNDATTETGNLLHRAISHCRKPSAVSVVETLLKAGVNLEAKMEDSRGTPLSLISEIRNALGQHHKNNKKKTVRAENQRINTTLDQCQKVLKDRKRAASTMVTNYMKHHDITQLPDDALVYFSNIGKEGLLFKSEVWQQHPEKMLSMLEKMPPAFMEHHGLAREVTALAAKMLAKESPDTRVAAGWSIEDGALDRGHLAFNIK